MSEILSVETLEDDEGTVVGLKFYTKHEVHIWDGNSLVTEPTGETP